MDGRFSILAIMDDRKNIDKKMPRKLGGASGAWVEDRSGEGSVPAGSLREVNEPGAVACTCEIRWSRGREVQGFAGSCTRRFRNHSSAWDSMACV